MILPIKLTGRPGLPGEGVPQFSLDPSTGKIIGSEFWPQGATDPATGEPSTSSIDYGDHPGLWQGGQTFGPQDPSQDPNTLNPAAIWDYRGSQWPRRGSYQTESGFDKWRRAGKPTACSMGDWSGTIQQAIDAGVIGAAAASLPPGSVIQSGPGGITVYNPGATGGYGSGVPQGGGAVTVSGGASPMAWLFGGLIVVGLVWAVNKR